MKACIHRGTQQIGGTCVELESQDVRIVLDIGLPLEAGCAYDDPTSLSAVSGFSQADPSLLGVVISHPHLDHYGLAHHLPSGTRFLIGQAAQRMLAAADPFSPAGVHLEPCIFLEDRKRIDLGPFTITPYLMDHSAYDAYAVLIQADGRALFYTGDLRAHGRKGKLFDKLLRLGPERVDVLLMEGTTIGRTGAAKGFETEEQLEVRLAAVFKRTAGMALAWCSGQNIDRLVTVFKAARRAGRGLIIDMYTAEMLRATGNPHLPQAEWEGVRVFLPSNQKRRITAAEVFHVAERYKSRRSYPETLAAAAPRSVMIFRPSMADDLDRAHCLSGARMVYSMWTGYLRDPRTQRVLDWLRERDIALEECHTSGHAAVADLQRLRRHFAAASVVPIHTQHADQFEELFGNVQLRKDGEPWDV
jgi:ribonuclease J